MNALEKDLRRQVRGEVRFDAGTRAAYSTDGSNYRQVPIGIVVPRDVDDAVAAVAVCRSHEVPVLSRGGGTSLAGQCCNIAVIIDFTKIDYIDSTGIGELVGYLGKFTTQNRKLILVNPSERIQKLLKLAKLDVVFKIYGSEEEAISAESSAGATARA